MDWTWYLFRFDGRISRARLWLAIPLLFGLMMTVGLAVVAIQGLFGRAAPFHFGASDLFKLVDPGAYRSLTWADLPRLLIKLVGNSLLMWVGLYNQFADRLPDSYADLPLALAAAGLCLWGFIEMYLLNGSPRTNRFGADPLAPPPTRDTRPPWDQQSEIEMVPHKAGPSPV
jgi:uncharacterized membrane protein YhaH (DUF805 family)